VAQWDSNGSLVLPLDYIQLAFGVTVGGLLSQDAAGTNYTFYFTLDDCGPDNKFACAVSQSGTTVTVQDPKLSQSGGVTAGDIVHVFDSGTPADGWYVVAGASTTNYTATSLTSQTIGVSGGYHGYWRLFAAPPALTGQTARSSACLAHSTTGPATGLILKASAGTAGSVTGIVVQGAGPG
jgi:hypothetical protein